MKFSIKNFFSKCDQIRSFRRIWSHLQKKFLMENLIFCAVYLSESKEKRKANDVELRQDSHLSIHLSQQQKTFNVS